MKKSVTKQTMLFASSFAPSAKALQVLTEGKILGENETAQEMIERVVHALITVEDRFKTPQQLQQTLAQKLGYLLDNKYCVMSTPIMTNAGRHIEKPLSACSVPPIDLGTATISELRSMIHTFHQDGMGTGFNLDSVPDPAQMLRQLNTFALESVHSGKEERPVGNMAILSVYHPRILDFINAKVAGDEKGVEWKFNISVNCNNAFIQAVKQNASIKLSDGTEISARFIFEKITEAAHACADPGLIFLERMEEDNPTPGVGFYSAPAPCAEVGLAPGEACQFAYINLGKFVTNHRTINWDKLRTASELLTRVLDNALEISIDNYSEQQSKYVMSQKRKIGIGICGLADMLMHMQIPYTDPRARIVAQNMVAFINYYSKSASCELAKERGSFGAMSLTLGNKHLEKPSWIFKKYGNLETKYISEVMWQILAEQIQETRLLRNASTIALPPTGRSGLVIDASTGIEPVFSREEYRLIYPEELWGEAGIQIATEISPEDHLLMTAAIQETVDESISKTINMPSDATVEMVSSIYLKAWDLGLKGISIYREGSKKQQPRKLH